MVDRFARDWRTAGLDPPTLALMAFAEKLTASASSIRAVDIEGLRQHGFDDRAISSATQVVAYFNYINRIAEGLGVPVEHWLDPDGRPKPTDGPRTEEQQF
ncbi:MAG: peroxidase [Acidimicrobiia bacterium]